jgi:hypothetical protein
MSAISFGNLNGGAKKSNVKYMKLVDGDNTFRILPNSILPGYTYWVKGANGKDLPFNALQYISKDEAFDNSLPCPIRDKGLKDAKGEDLGCQWSYKCQVINRATGAVEVLQLKKGILSDIISVAQQLGFDPTDLESGTDFTVTRKKTGPLPFNVEYTLQQLKCKQAPVSDTDKALLADIKPIEELFPAETYEAQMERLVKHLTGAKPDEEAKPDAAAQEAVNELG